MEDLLFKIWLGMGIFLVVGEFLLPGLVVVFVGMGALTVALGMYLGQLEDLPYQLMTFFLSSLLYLFTLRLLVLRFVPTDSVKVNINEDQEVIGQIVEVVESISINGTGRIEHSGSSWQARCKTEEEILKNQKVKIVGRDNITWIVEKI